MGRLVLAIEIVCSIVQTCSKRSYGIGRRSCSTDYGPNILNYQTNLIGQDVQILVFSSQLHFLLVQITEDPPRLIVRLNEHGNGFESWRQLHERFSLPDRARGVSLLNQLLDFKFQDTSFDADLTEFLSCKHRHKKATTKPLQDDLSVTRPLQDDLLVTIMVIERKIDSILHFQIVNSIRIL